MQPGSGQVLTTAFEPAQTVQGTQLVLNGSGTRLYRAVFKVYDMALYTPRKVKALEELLALQGPVRLNFVAQRDIPARTWGVLHQGLGQQLVGRADSPLHARQQPVDRDLLGPPQAVARRDLCHGIPARQKGTTFYIEGQPQGAPAGRCEYFGMVLRIWLGSVPVDHQLKGSAAALRYSPQPRGAGAAVGGSGQLEAVHAFG